MLIEECVYCNSKEEEEKKLNYSARHAYTKNNFTVNVSRVHTIRRDFFYFASCRWAAGFIHLIFTIFSE